MPLSEEELRLLEQMERALVEEDPKFASTLRGTNLRRAAQRKAVLSALAVVLGLVLLMAGVILQLPLISVLGFVAMLGGVTFGLAVLKMRPSLAEPHHSSENHGFTVINGGKRGRGRSKPGKTSFMKMPKSGTFMQRLEQRWERRRREW